MTELKLVVLLVSAAWLSCALLFLANCIRWSKVKKRGWV